MVLLPRSPPVRPRTGHKSARMYARHDDRRIDSDHYEASPSTGSEEVATILDALDGYDHSPPCEECNRDGEPIVVLDGDTPTRISVRCSIHAKGFLEVSA